jgi:SPP1 gp7 family putative phage head morphogenesis protein
MADESDVNENAFDDVTTHRLAVLRYEAGTTEALLKAYDAALRDVDREMVNLRRRILSGQSVDRRRLERLVSLGTDLAKRIRELRRVLVSTLDERLTEVAETEAAFTDQMLATRFGGASLTTVPEAAVATAVRSPIGGGIWTDRLAADLLAENDAMQAVLARALAKGASMENIAKALGEGTGIVETYRNRLVAIARTETQRVANDVALATYAENTDVLSGVQWLATLDSRTCLVCAPLHNRVWRYDALGRLPRGFSPPPRHPRCRCFASPLSRSWRDLGFDVPASRRAYFTDKPAKETTFDAWLKRQSRDVQLEVFDSEARLDAWRSGALKLSQFSDAGRVLGVGELRSRYPDVGV